MFALVWRASAQTYDFNTNNLRVVNGHVYDVTTSIDWSDISRHEKLGIKNTDDEIERGYHIDAGAVANIKGTTVLYEIIRKHWTMEIEQFTPTPRKSYDEHEKYVVILNCPHTEKLIAGEGAKFTCMRTTNSINKDGISFVTYDCGTPPTLDEANKFKADTEERQKAAQKELGDQRHAAAEKADAAKKAVQAKVLKSNQDLADKGDAYGLLRMGERYRDGEGVEKDLAKAKDYLTKSAAAGSLTAAEELSKLNPVSTNSPATQ
jgi:hypothetical protein